VPEENSRLGASGSEAGGRSRGTGLDSCARARVHNLKNISFRYSAPTHNLDHWGFRVGKSSLAFEHIYAEGQRRYKSSLFLSRPMRASSFERIEKPDVDEITGIAPAIAIKQKNSTRNPRSTVATSATEIYDYLRLLYARAGRT